MPPVEDQGIYPSRTEDKRRSRTAEKTNDADRREGLIGPSRLLKLRALVEESSLARGGRE